VPGANQVELERQRECPEASQNGASPVRASARRRERRPRLRGCQAEVRAGEPAQIGLNRPTAAAASAERLQAPGGHHVAHVLAKLGLRNRAEIAARLAATGRGSPPF
jgi:hypothetical protein